MELWDHLPRTEDSLRCVAVLAVTLSIGGCFGGGGIGRLSIKGYVTEIDTTNFERFEAGLVYSAPGVQGATVALTGTGHVATTNSRGEFTFYDVPPGVYNVMVMKDGWASSAAYNVYVDSDRTTEVELRMVKPSGQGPIIEKAIPPQVNVGSTQSPEPSVRNIDISASSAYGIWGILLFIDNTPVKAFVPVSSSGISYPWDTASGDFPVDSGEHTITAIAIDTYGNIGCMSIVVTVDHIGEPVPPPQAPINVMAMSTTVHYSVFDLTVELGERGLLSQSVSTVNETYGMPRHLQMIESGVRPLAMPAGSDAAIYCDVLWNNNDPTVKGFKVYRDGIFIGQLPASESESGSLLMNPNPIPEIMPPVPEYYYTDGSSKLTPNVPVSYRVSAYNSWGEGNKSASVTVTPLNALSEVIVVQPQISAIVPDPGDYLHFQWNKVPNAKLYYIDVISADGTLMWEGYAYGNENSVAYGDPARTIWESGSLTPGQYYFFIRAFNFRENPPVPFDFNWIPKEVSSSASKLGMFNIL